MKNFHNKPFDEGTLTKLELFKSYVESWLPVFLSPKYSGKTVTLVDFFAGPGRDSEGIEGSPLILVRKVREYTKLIRENRVVVKLVLNEKVKSKALALEKEMERQAIPSELLQWEVHSLAFDEAFDKLYPLFPRSSNLIFLDQQGIKFISDDILYRITQLKRTDFIFFIASSFIRRFRDHPYFKKHIHFPETISGKDFSDVHRAVTDYYQSIVQTGTGVQLAPFSIKKGSNIYGVIFGSAHVLGMEKFLNVCWKTDPDNGEANFDIDGESIDPVTPRLFPEMDITKKVLHFQSDLQTSIMDGTLANDGEVYFRCLSCGMLPKHGRAVVKELVKSGKIRVEQGLQPRVSRDGWKDPRSVEVVKSLY